MSFRAVFLSQVLVVVLEAVTAFQGCLIVLRYNQSILKGEPMSCNELDVQYLKTVTILYVEDNTETRENLAKFIERRVGRLLTAVNGADGLKKFVELQPQIIVTDILMPEMDGLEMSRKIRELDGSVPIIVTTAFEQTDYMLRSIEIGIDKYVVKPVNCSRLNAVLLECAHRLRAEELLKEQRRLESEALRIRNLEALNALAAGMSHDFNNLLQAILGFVYLAKVNAEPGSKVQEFLQMADNCSLQARELGERLLLLAKGDSPVFRNASLGSIIKSTVNGLLNGTTISFEFDIPDNLPLITCEDSQIQELMSHLTRNALEAMPEGGRLWVSVAACNLSTNDKVPLTAGDYLHVTITDTGIGITPEQLPKIFDPYFSTRNIGCQKGMGLGLAFCDAIVRRHGGMIKVESTPGDGAVVNIWLPVSFTLFISN